MAAAIQLLELSRAVLARIPHHEMHVDHLKQPRVKEASCQCDLSACDLGACDLGACDLGTCDLGACDLGTCDLGTCDLGACDLGACDARQPSDRVQALTDRVQALTAQLHTAERACMVMRRDLGHKQAEVDQLRTQLTIRTTALQLHPTA